MQPSMGFKPTTHICQGTHAYPLSHQGHKETLTRQKYILKVKCEEQEFGEAICNLTNKVSKGKPQLYLITSIPLSFFKNLHTERLEIGTKTQPLLQSLFLLQRTSCTVQVDSESFLLSYKMCCIELC